MKIVVAGGSGTLGSALVPALLDAGHSVAVFTRDASRARSRVDRRGELVEWNPSSAGPWEQAIESAGGVINLAGEPIAAERWTAERKERLRASRIEATTALVRASVRADIRPGVFITASGVGYYGARGDEILTEEAPAGSDFLAAMCREREEAARAAEALGARVVLMRIGVVLSAEAGPLAKLVRPFRAGLGGPLGSGRQWWSWIHRDDVVGLFRFAMENEEARGPINVTAPAPVTVAELCRTLGRVLGRPSWLPVPAPVLRGLIGEIAEMALGSLRAEPREALRLGYGFRYPALEGALRAVLGRR